MISMLFLQFINISNSECSPPKTSKGFNHSVAVVVPDIMMSIFKIDAVLSTYIFVFEIKKNEDGKKVRTSKKPIFVKSNRF